MLYLHLKEINFDDNINKRVFAIFMARDVSVRTQKDGVTKFISLNMCDKDILIDAKKFGATEQEINAMKNGGVYSAAIDIKPYDKSPTGYSCTLYNFDTYDENPSNFVIWADGMDKAQNIIKNSLQIISNSIYKNLVYNIVANCWNDFCIWTAASNMHHNIMGGLIVHTAEVIELSEQIANYWQSKYGYNFINKPLLLSGALLHDIGKTKELDLDKSSGTTSYSDLATLETHISICVGFIDVEAYKIQLGYPTETKTKEQVDFEKEAVSLLKHIILSHHGKPEYGSMINMNIPEALIVNKADELSAEMFRFNKNFNTMEPASSNTVWLSGNMVSTYKDSSK